MCDMQPGYCRYLSCKTINEHTTLDFAQQRMIQYRLPCFKPLSAARWRWYIFISFIWVIFVYTIYKYQSSFLHIRSQGPALGKKYAGYQVVIAANITCLCCHGNGISCWLSWRGLRSVTAVRQNTCSIIVRENRNI